MSSSAVPGELLSTILRQEPTYYDAAKACKYLVRTLACCVLFAELALLPLH